MMILEEASDAHSLCLDDTAVAAKVWPALAESPMAFGTEGSAHRNETLDEPENEFILEMPPPPKEETNTENWCLHHDDEANRCNNLSAQQHYDGEKLAVAVAITDDFEYATRADEDSCLPCAVELDPDSEGGRGVRNSLLSSYRLRVSAIAFLVVVVVVVVVGTTVVLRTAQKDHGSKDRSTLGIRQAVEAVVGGENLLEETGPYGKALDWITYSDPTEPKPEQSNFLQRYLAVYFYFATSAEREWNACARPRVNDVDDCFFSVSVSQQKGDTLTSDILGYRWLSKRNECLWIGVTCNKEDQIVVLNLGINMTGLFPIGIQFFPYLTDLRIGMGKLRGSLPHIVGNMKQLTHLGLQQNEFSGSIPVEWYQLSNLQMLDLSYNYLEGSISSKIDGLEKIEYFWLYNNQLTGRIPEEIGTLANLEVIKLQHNLLQGEIPSAIGNLTSTRQMSFDRNRLTGSIPTEIAKLATTLSQFSVADNFLVGDLPETIYEVRTLDLLDVSGCNLTGTISKKIFQLSNLNYLLLDNNHFSGSLPTELSLLTQLFGIMIAGNDLRGEVPPEFCAQFGSHLKYFVANCKAKDNGGLAEIVCPNNCCTRCCNSDGKLCLPTGP